MKVYIAGVVSNGNTLSIAEQKVNAKPFYAAEDFLREAGHEPVNPLRLNPVGDGTSWLDVMRTDLKALLDCDAVYALEGWDLGRGSAIEVFLAKGLGLPIIHEVI